MEAGIFKIAQKIEGFFIGKSGSKTAKMSGSVYNNGIDVSGLIKNSANSGFDTTLTSVRFSTRSISMNVPIGTVDFVITTDPDFTNWEISSTADINIDRSAEPSSDCGVARQRNTNSANFKPWLKSVVKDNVLFSMPICTISSSPASMIGI